MRRRNGAKTISLQTTFGRLNYYLTPQSTKTTTTYVDGNQGPGFEQTSQT